jgi:hypothetical protein
MPGFCQLLDGLMLFLGLVAVYFSDFFIALGARFFERLLGLVHVLTGRWLMYLTFAVTRELRCWVSLDRIGIHGIEMHNDKRTTSSRDPRRRHHPRAPASRERPPTASRKAQRPLAVKTNTCQARTLNCATVAPRRGDTDEQPRACRGTSGRQRRG